MFLTSYKAGPAGSHLTGNEKEFRKTIGTSQMMKAVQLSDNKGRYRNPVKLIIRFVQLLSLEISPTEQNPYIM